MTWPRLISQTWKTRRLPAEADRLSRTWIDKNPDYEIRLFDDADSRAVVAEVAPFLLDLYDAAPLPVMRADMFRYAVVYRDGGIYADVDMECLKSIAPLANLSPCLLSVEAQLSKVRTRELGYAAPFQIANCIFAAAPRQTFFLAALKRIQSLMGTRNSIDVGDVEDVTGPRMLSRLFFEAPWPHVSVAPQILLMAPLNYPDVWPVNRNMYARHRTFGTWKTQRPAISFSRVIIERNRLPNPFPRSMAVSSRELVPPRLVTLPGSQ